MTGLPEGTEKKRVGRPPKLPDNGTTRVETVVAEFLARACNIPGCVPRFHIEDAHALLIKLEETDIAVTDNKGVEK